MTKVRQTLKLIHEEIHHEINHSLVEVVAIVLLWEDVFLLQLTTRLWGVLSYQEKGKGGWFCICTASLVVVFSILSMLNV